jgi:hypothetical protein
VAYQQRATVVLPLCEPQEFICHSNGSSVRQSHGMKTVRTDARSRQGAYGGRSRRARRGAGDADLPPPQFDPAAAEQADDQAAHA